MTLARQAEGHFAQEAAQAMAAPGGPFRPPTAEKVAILGIFEAWAAERKPAQKTVYEWRRVTQAFITSLGHDDAAQVTAVDVLRWKDTLVRANLRPKTINDAKLVPIRTILGWAVANQKLTTNPADGIGVVLKRKAGESKLGYSDSEAHQILLAAEVHMNLVIRWVPWIGAYTGARIAEICQLRTQDIQQIEGIWTIKFTSEDGSLKTANSERLVPIHTALIASGFVTYVQDLIQGPLFASLPPDRFGSRGGNGTKVVGRWVRSLGITNPRLQPSHAWRHRMRTSARRYGIPDSAVGALVGHAQKNIGDRYGEFPISFLADELAYTKVR